MVDLDDDAKQRLMALKSQIDNMLKIRSDDWTGIIQFEQLEFNELICKKLLDSSLKNVSMKNICRISFN
jgi:hypothetical protein